MNITKQMKDDAIDAAMKDIFTKRIEALCKEAKTFAEELYDRRYAADVAALKKAKTEHNWMGSTYTSVNLVLTSQPSNSCQDVTQPDHQYRYNTLKRYFITDIYSKLSRAYTFSKPRPFPPMVGNALVLTDQADIDRAVNIHHAMNALCQEEKELREVLNGFLKSCRKLKHIETNWPTGLKYFPTEVTASLPIPLIDRVIAAQLAA